MTSSEIILEIIAYAKKQGVDFETALRMFQMMYFILGVVVYIIFLP